jgi:hypothetical protein
MESLFYPPDALEGWTVRTVLKNKLSSHKSPKCFTGLVRLDSLPGFGEKLFFFIHRFFLSLFYFFILFPSKTVQSSKKRKREKKRDVYSWTVFISNCPQTIQTIHKLSRDDPWLISAR